MPWGTVKLRPGIVTQWTPILNEAGVSEKIFKGFTPSGNRRYADLTAKNASKEMNTKRIQNGEGWHYGLGSIRAMVAPRLKNISEIKNMSEILRKRDSMDFFYNKLLESKK